MASTRLKREGHFEYQLSLESGGQRDVSLGEGGGGREEYLHGSFNDFISPVPIRERLEDFLHYKFQSRGYASWRVGAGGGKRCNSEKDPEKGGFHFYVERDCSLSFSCGCASISLDMHDLPTCPLTNCQTEGGSL